MRTEIALILFIGIVLSIYLAFFRQAPKIDEVCRTQTCAVYYVESPFGLAVDTMKEK